MGSIMINVGGVVCAGSDGFRWDMVMGSEPPEIPISVTIPVDEKFGTLPPIVPILANQVKIAPGTGGRGSFYQLDVKEAVLLRRDRATAPDLVQWILTDTRYFLQGLHSETEFNESRGGNDFVKLAEGTPGDYEKRPIQYWRPHTIKKKGQIQLANLLNEDSSGIEKWTAFQALQFMMTTYFKNRERKVIIPGIGEFNPRVDFSKVKDNEVPLSNFPGGNWGEVVDGLSRLAHVDFFVDLDGVYQFRSLDPTALPAHVGNYNEAGTPIWQDRSRERSENPIVLFRPEIEFRGQYIEPESTILGTRSSTVARGGDVEEFNASNIENVVKVPDDIYGVDGTLYEAGVYVEFTKYLDLCENDPNDSYPLKGSVPKLDINQVREFVHSIKLSSKYAANGIITDPKWAARMDAISSAFRKLFRVKPALMAGLDKISDELVRIKDPTSHGRARAKVWMDETNVFNSIRYAKRGSVTTGSKDFSQGSPRSPDGWPETGKTLGELKIIGVDASNAKVNVINPSLGVFSVDWRQDKERNVTFHYHGHLADIPNGRVGRLLSLTPKVAEQFRLTDKFRLVVLMSAVINTPNNTSRLHQIQAKGLVPIPKNAKGPPVEIVADEMFAGLAWSDEKGSRLVQDSQTGQIRFFNYELVNESVLKDIARSKIRDYYYVRQDRQLGTFKGAVFDASVDEPSGSFSRVSAVFDGQGALEVEYSSTGELQTPPLAEGFDDKSKRIILRLARKRD